MTNSTGFVGSYAIAGCTMAAVAASTALQTTLRWIFIASSSKVCIKENQDPVQRNL